MKTILFFAVWFYGLSVFSQSYYVTFKGLDTRSDVTSVKIENLSRGTSIEVPGKSVLWLTYSTGLPAGYEQSLLKIYPNPMTESARIDFVAPVSGNTRISIISMTGVIVVQTTMFLENVSQSFVISGLKRGIYVVNVKGNSFQFFQRIVSNNSLKGIPAIRKFVEPHEVFADQNEIRRFPGMSADTIVMEYSDGERIKFTGRSGNKRTVFVDVPKSDNVINFEFIPCADGDSNHYSVVRIDNNFWMAENLKTSRFNDGTPISYLDNDAIWLNIDTSYTAYYCLYDNGTVNRDKYGNLYNWVAAGFEWKHELCPVNWHVLKYYEFFDAIKLLDPSVLYLEEVLRAGGKLKETGTTHWQAPNAGASNESGFSALPGGIRGVSPSGLGKTGSWWLGYGEGFDLNYNQTSIYYWHDRYNGGRSVRCVRDLVSTRPVESISSDSAISGGEVLGDKGSPIFQRGVCWSIVIPTAAGPHTSDGIGLGSFTSRINGLSPGTSYYVRAYAINQKDTLYGKIVEFRTLMAH